jgi:hypothetical protein
MDIAEFRETISQYGLEYFNLYISHYRGSVVDNKDPDHLGRLKINVPQIHGASIPNYWCPSIGIPGGSNVAMWLLPKIGDTIWVTFEQGNPAYPIWHYGPMVQMVTPAARKDNNYVFQSSKGQRIELDDDKEMITITNKAGFIVQLGKDGINIGKGNETLGKALDDLISQINQIVVSTAMGPSSPDGPLNRELIGAVGDRLKKILGDAID